MLKRFETICEELIKAGKHPDGDIVVDYYVSFKKKTQKYANMLAEIMVVTKSLQTDKHALADCRDDLDDLNKAIEEEKRMQGSPFLNCRLGTEYISPTSTFVKYPHFEAAVIKMQRGRVQDLTDDEKEAVKCLRVSDSTNASADDGDGDSSLQGINVRFAEHRKVMKETC